MASTRHKLRWLCRSMKTSISNLLELKKRKYMLLSILGVLCVVVMVVLAGQQVLTANQLRQKAADQKAQTEQIRQKAMEAQAVLSSAEYAQSQEIVNKALPNTKPFLDLLANLDRAGLATGVTVSNLSISPGSLATVSATTKQTSQDKQYEAVDLSFTVTSTFDAFREFMSTLEKVAPFTTVIKFDISERVGTQISDQQANADVQLVSVNVVTETYFLSVPQGGGVAIKPLSEAEKVVLAEIEKLQSVDLPVQTEVQGGGLEDLFGVAGYKDVIQALR